MKFEELKTALSSYIKTEKLGPGDPLPSIVDLTRIFRLSGTTVRRAVRELTEEGVLNVIQGSGVYVAARRRGIRIVHVVTRTGKVPTGFQSSPKAIWPVLQAEAERRGVSLNVIRPDAFQYAVDEGSGILVMANCLDRVAGKLTPAIKAVVFDSLEEHRTPTVWEDQTAGAYHAADLLLEHGHTRIGYAAWYTTHRDLPSLRGILRAHEVRGVPFSPMLLVRMGPDEEDEDLDRAREEGMTALMLKGHRILPAVCEWAARNGIGVPRDLSLIGLSGHRSFLENDPPITTLEDTMPQQARSAFELLDEYTVRKSLKCKHKRIVPRIVEGGSVRALAK